MPGYSGTPLPDKLGIKPTHKICVLNSPKDYAVLVQPLPEGVTITHRLSSTAHLIHLFTTKRRELERMLKTIRKSMNSEAAIWVSWPKKSSNVETDVTEDTIREVALPLGLVDVKVCAVDDVWSGLKLMIRKELREKVNRQRRA